MCPPPTVILDGASWWTNKKQEQSDSITSITANNNNNINSSPPQLVVSMSGETSETQEGQVDWYSMAGTTVGQTGFGGNTSGGSSGRNNSLRNSFDKSSSSDRDWYRIQPRDPLAGGKCVLRQLYINDADDKRKRVECLARLQLADGTPIGTLASKPVKVISKPSKKRLSVKNMDCRYLFCFFFYISSCLYLIFYFFLFVYRRCCVVECNTTNKSVNRFFPFSNCKIIFSIFFFGYLYYNNSLHSSWYDRFII